MNHLIIGGGPAAFRAASLLRRLDRQSRITVLSRENLPPYARIALPYLVSGAVDEELLFLPMPGDVELLTGEEACEIRPERREVRTSSGKAIPYDRLLLATGADPVKPEIRGIDLPFVFTLRDIPDARSIRKISTAKNSGRAVIAGAGPVGLEIGDALRKAGFAVTLVIASDRLFSAMLDAPASAFLEKRLADKGVEVRKNESITGILPSGRVALSSGATAPCDIVVFGKGVAPRLAYLASSGIVTRRGILVDRCQQTSVPGIYAAGDAAETADIVYGDSRVNALWPEALEQATVAAANMASRPLAYEGSFSRNTMHVFDTSIQVAGMTRDEGGQVRRQEGPDFHRKLVLNDGILKGFIFLGDVRTVGFYSDLLRRKARIGSFADSFLRGSLDYARFLKERILEHHG